jgi:hypothetical protein
MTHLNIITVPTDKIRHSDVTSNDGINIPKCSIDRNGAITVMTGHYAVMQARINRQPEILMKVVYRHPEWIALKEEFQTQSPHDKHLYGRIDHPDFADWHFSHTNDERLEMVAKEIWSINPHHTLLELCSHTGWFCHRLTDMGIDCTGVEISPMWADFSERMNYYFRHWVDFFACDVVDYFRRHGEAYNVIMILNAIHHIAKQGKLEAMLLEVGERCQLFICDYDAELWGEHTQETYIAMIERLSGLKYRHYLGAEPNRQRKLLSFRRGE